jgi:hypothetical protein
MEAFISTLVPVVLSTLRLPAAISGASGGYANIGNEPDAHQFLA